MAEAVAAEKAEARESYVRRQAEKYERLAEYALDAENRQRYEARAGEWRAEAERSFNKNGDPVYDALGPASRTHPDEIKRIIAEAGENGVLIVEKPGNMAYSPGLHKGLPGQLHISRSDSIGAWLHEEQHMLDDMQDGWPGFSGLFDVDRRCRMEYNAYRKEIELALSMGREDLADELRRLCRREIESFGGVWDAERLDP